MVETVGRRVRVTDSDGERLCFLSGQRAVVGDEVTWVEAQGEGGKLIQIATRRNLLQRVDARGEEQVLAANLAGLLVCVAAVEPAFQASLLDRYLVAASQEKLAAVIVVTKTDLGVPESVEEELRVRAALGYPILRISNPTGAGLDELRAYIASSDHTGPWALVGHSGVGKTSLISALLPAQDVGPIGDISEYWGAGKHTTTHTRLFALPGGGEIADSPGIRGFTPAGVNPESVRDHFPGMHALGCKYRDCLHKIGEEGCVADEKSDPSLLRSYRDLLEQATGVWKRKSR